LVSTFIVFFYQGIYLCAIRVFAAEIGVPILPRFFLVTTQSGVKSMTLSLDSARERIYQTGHTVIECVGASWTYRYRNGYTVTLRGPLTAHVIATSKTPPGSNTGDNSDFMYKFDEFQFDANFHDKFIALESILGVRSIENLPPPTPMMVSAPSPSAQAAAAGSGPVSQNQADDERKWEEPRLFIDRASLPGEPVNAFGIPQATMRCLELAESVTSMAELIQFARESSRGSGETSLIFDYFYQTYCYRHECDRGIEEICDTIAGFWSCSSSTAPYSTISAWLSYKYQPPSLSGSISIVIYNFSFS